jgi:hypothetical protein
MRQKRLQLAAAEAAGSQGGCNQKAGNTRACKTISQPEDQFAFQTNDNRKGPLTTGVDSATDGNVESVWGHALSSARWLDAGTPFVKWIDWLLDILFWNYLRADLKGTRQGARFAGDRDNPRAAFVVFGFLHYLREPRIDMVLIGMHSEGSGPSDRELRV